LQSLSQAPALITMSLKCVFFGNSIAGNLPLGNWQPQDRSTFPFPRLQNLELTIDINDGTASNCVLLVLCLDLRRVEVLKVTYIDGRRRERDGLAPSTTPFSAYVGGQFSRNVAFTDTLHVHCPTYERLRTFELNLKMPSPPTQLLPKIMPLMPHLQNLRLRGNILPPVVDPTQPSYWRYLSSFQSLQLQEMNIDAPCMEGLVEYFKIQPFWSNFRQIKVAEPHGFSSDDIMHLKQLMQGKEFLEVSQQSAEEPDDGVVWMYHQ